MKLTLIISHAVSICVERGLRLGRSERRPRVGPVCGSSQNLRISGVGGWFGFEAASKEGLIPRSHHFVNGF